MRKAFARVLTWPIAVMAICCLVLAEAATAAASSASGKRPNVIVLLTDDQGYGDLGCHGHPLLKTPNLDRLHNQSVRFADFHVTPMCTSTRSSIMTGRDCLATGAYVVCSGHGFVRRELPTMADIFAAGGYRTGLFGKWHLGDYYPYRPQDRGFQETVSFAGWGVSGSQDHWLNNYYDDTYLHNGKPRKYSGYCTDVWFTEAMNWMRSCADRNEPFFVYLPTNAPHGPMYVPEEYARPYMDKVDPLIARFFGMVANLDENVGRLDVMLRETGLYENTLLVFMTDNGPTKEVYYYNAGLRGGKTEYYEGGHRVPCFVRWPAGGLLPSSDVLDLVQGQDLLPTLAELCDLSLPEDMKLDGVSVAGILRGRAQPELAERKLVVQIAAWDEYLGPNKWNCAVMWNKWRLVKGNELYDVQRDLGQEADIAADHPEVVAALRAHYEDWWARVEPLAREYQPIHLGSDHEPLTCLGSQDWVAPNTASPHDIRKGVNRNGPWHVLVERAGMYEIALRRWPAEADAVIAGGVPAYQGALGKFAAGKVLPITKARLKVGEIDESKPVAKNDKAAMFTLSLPKGRTVLQTWFLDEAGQELCGAYYVYVRRVRE